MFNKKVLENIIQYTLSLGADYVEINSIKKEMLIDTLSTSGKSSKIYKESGTTITYYYDGTKYTISTTNDNMKKICKEIKRNFYIKNIKKFKSQSINFKLNQLECEEISSDFDYFNDEEYLIIIKNFCTKHPQISNLRIPLLYERRDTCIANSNSKYIIKTENHYKLDILMSVFANNKTRFNYYSKGNSSRKNLLKKIDLEYELNTLYNSLKKTYSKEGFSKKIPVVLAKGIGGVIIHEACGHSLESREIIKSKSILNSCNNINNPLLTIIDDPTLPNLFGSSKFDDEGNRTHKTELIKNGKIINYLIDNEGSKILDVKNNCCGRRESYYNLMSSRMSNTYISPGDSNFDEIISTIKYGIYVTNIASGVVDTISGNFSFNCLETYFIINGKIDYTKAYDNFSIIGNAMKMMNKISMIGNDLEYSCGLCGSESGLIFTTVGQPTIKIEELLVEG